MANIKAFRELTPETEKLLNDLNLEILGSELSGSFDTVRNKPNLLALIAFIDNKAVAFKLGFSEPEKPQSFYSWSGGVLPDFRSLAIASKLMKTQHSLLKEMKVSEVTTKCREDRLEMISLNKKFGFNLVETYQSQQNPKYQKHLFVKDLT